MPPNLRSTFSVKMPPSVDTGCFCVGALINNAAVKRVLYSYFVSFGYIPMSGTAGSSDDSLFLIF